MKQVVLAVDVGNTSTTLGYFKGPRLIKRLSFLTCRLKKFPHEKIKLPKNQIPQKILISSVVPGVNRVVKRLLHSTYAVPVVWIGRDLPVPIANRAQNPREVGVDRLLNAYQAYQIFKGPCIAVDFGTAITFDVVSKKGEYLGGVIAPGIELTLNALFEKTALIPRVKLRHPKRIVGRNTAECIRSGCAYGLGALCDGILNEISRKANTPFCIIATGGYSLFMKRYSKRIRCIDQDLTLKAIYSVYNLSMY